MPQRKTKIKSMKLDKIRRMRNRRVKQELQKAIKKYLSLLSVKEIENAKKAFGEVMSKLDKAVKKGIIKKNTASRRKSRLSLKLKTQA
ncbi:MAG: 30S ribosomal protein S20 [Candidatus Omnitrophica bacterium CG11_big_fil_rev_8_21_14_0_20_42_13]|uniref:Small ribosomal subunit protein bS20 n=1 Tax=Candidatus Ghiorseimicrobium undicola TaxID=1974746 RepID=A0A2H0LZU8_9BACT|nr:MAG: 30S ribosomal protein S20 [Candidatus Omnitrophica bacterium CG11_big_fil_rev_8_21_14_0_20_42_13]